MPESLFNKVAGLGLATLLKKRIWLRCFLVNFAKFLRTPFFLVAASGYLKESILKIKIIGKEWFNFLIQF